MREQFMQVLWEQALTPAFYRFIAALMATAMRLFARWEVRGAERVPLSGPLIVVSNHLNLADPPILAASLPRRIRFMAKHDLFEVRFGGFFISLFGAFPIRRAGSDLRALRTAQRMLESGDALGMFPEGHRSFAASMLQAHPGSALLALRSGALVLPVGITGSEQLRSARVLLERPRITVSVGEPFRMVPSAHRNGETLRAASDQIMHAIAELLPASYRGVYTWEEVI